MDTHARDRGVSDVLGFVLTVGLILTAATTAYVVGVDELNDVKQFEQQQGTSRSVELAADTFAEIYRGDAPRRAVEFDVSDRTLAVEASSITIGVEDGSFDELDSRTYDTGALSLDTGGTVASFESGLVAERFEKTALDRRRPPIVCNDATTTLTVVELEGDASYSGGSVVVDATHDAAGSGLEELSHTDTEWVVIDVSDSVNRDAWGRSLEASGWTSSDSEPALDAGEYACSTDTVLVRHVVFDLQFRA
jgi:hypothetical protein